MSNICAFSDGVHGPDVFDARGELVVAHWGLNPLEFVERKERRLGEPPHHEAPDHSRLWVWSGWRGAAALDVDDDAPTLWDNAAWEALRSFCSGVAPALRERSALLLVRTHHRHVLSDTPSCLRFLREREAAGESDVFGLMLDGASMLAPSMRADARDHLRRIEEALAPLAGAVVDATTNAVVVRE